MTTPRPNDGPNDARMDSQDVSTRTREPLVDVAAVAEYLAVDQQAGAA